MFIQKQAHSKSTVALAPALVETYARLLVYLETETIGIKNFISVLLPAVFKSQVWGILHALLELFSHRVHHSPPHYRVQLLSTIHHMSVPLSALNHITQLHICLESVALRLISGLGNTELLSSFSRFAIESKTLISGESEELNKVLVLTLARAIHVTGFEAGSEAARWAVDFLKAIMAHTPHTWPSHTLQCFPQILHHFYKQVPAPRDQTDLKKEVEEEYRKWKSMSNENDKIAHFTHGPQTSTLFLCLLFKMVLDTDRVPSEAHKVLERLGPKQLMSHVRTLCDFLVLEFSNSSLGQYLSKCVDTMNALIWQHHIVPMDRLMLCLALRTQEGSSEAQVCMFIIQLLMLRPMEFRGRVKDFVADNSPEHWKTSNCYEQHMAFHRKYPERFSPESSQGPHTLPTYFTNVCLRFLPVLDIIIHRFLEVQQVHKRLEMVLEQIGALYKFHDHPITYLYNTLHYYEARLRESPKLKRQLVHAVISNSVKPKGWALTQTYQEVPVDDIEWTPPPSYYRALLSRLVSSLRGERVFPGPAEWRFNEFGNAASHATYVTCVELMALPRPAEVVADALIDAAVSGLGAAGANAAGLLLTWLPEPYWRRLYASLTRALEIQPDLMPAANAPSVFTALWPPLAQLAPSPLAPLAALAHAFWQHASTAQLAKLPALIADQLRPAVTCEAHLICLFQLVCPFLPRLNGDRDLPRSVKDTTVELYRTTAKIDQLVWQKGESLQHQDVICDVLYHIKYMFTGDSVKADLEPIILGLSPGLQKRLRFITHRSLSAIEKGVAGSEDAANTSLVH